MENYATLEDLENRLGEPLGDRRALATSLLHDASVKLAIEFERCQVDPSEFSEVKRERLMVVCCDMVRRFLDTIGNGDVSSMSTTAGPYTEQRTWANPTGSLKIYEDERRDLGIQKRRMSFHAFQTGAFDD